MTFAESETSWYCLKSQPKHEHIAAAHLRQMPGVEVFSPRMRFQRATTRGPKWFQESLFPGYLFAKFSFLERHKEVRYAMGVAAILNFGGRYTSISEAVIDGLRIKTNSEEIACIQPAVAEGDRVRIVDGALRGLEAVVTQLLSGKERVRVLLDFLGREIHAEVDRYDILTPHRHPLAA